MWLTWFSIVRSEQGESLHDRGVAEPVGDQGGDLEFAAGETGLGPAGHGQLGRKLGAERVHSSCVRRHLQARCSVSREVRSGDDMGATQRCSQRRPPLRSGFWLDATGPAVWLEGSDAGVSFRSMSVPDRCTLTVIANVSNGAWTVAGELEHLHLRKSRTAADPKLATPWKPGSQVNESTPSGATSSQVRVPSHNAGFRRRSASAACPPSARPCRSRPPAPPSPPGSEAALRGLRAAEPLGGPDRQDRDQPPGPRRRR